MDYQNNKNVFTCKCLLKKKKKKLFTVAVLSQTCPYSLGNFMDSSAKEDE